MNIYVGNLSLDVTEEELRQKFVNFGAVQSIVMMNDKYIGSGQSKGYGYIEMESQSEGKAAVEGLKNLVINNREIRVIEALPLDRKKPGIFKKRINKIRERS